MPNVELIYDNDCPNVPAAKAQLQEALKQTGLSSQWKEWDRGAADSPEYAKGYGSPTILIDGQDVAGLDPSADANCCRVYNLKEGMAGIPSLEMITTALKQAK